MSSGRRGGAAGKSPPCSRQPPRILVVDTRPPHWAHAGPKLCEALENVLSLACSLAGPPRLPLLSIYAAQNRQECLLPLAPVKGNFARLQSCVAELRDLPMEGAFRPQADPLAQAVQDGLRQFKQYTRQGMAGASLSASSAEISIVTSQPGLEVAKQLEASLRGMDLLNLRQVQVVEISRGPCQEPPDAKGSSHAGEGAGGSGGSSDENSGALGTEIDLQTVEHEVLALEAFFKGWFHDHGMDREHLHLLLPPGASSCPATSGLECVKCDLQERLLSPALLPGACSEGTARVEDAGGPFWMAAGPRLAPRRLRVIRALKAEGLCESVLFGLPLMVKPTSCWKLNWDELEANLQSFQALCHCLKKRQWLLLAKYEAQGPGPSWGAAGADAHQVLMPSAASSSLLLLRSVAAQELLLPCSCPLLPTDPPEAALGKMEGILDSLRVEPAYDPLSATSHLYRALRSSLGRPPTSRAQRLAGQQLPRQRPTKARATVAPLQMAPPAASLALFSSEEEEVLDSA